MYVYNFEILYEGHEFLLAIPVTIYRGGEWWVYGTPRIA